MKRFILSVVALSAAVQLFAQTHLIEVARLQNWGREYLTVTSMYSAFSEAEKTNYLLGFSIVGEDNITMPLPGSIITAINDESTKGMSTKRFYEILDANEKQGVKLSLLTRENLSSGEIVIKSFSELPDFLTKSGLTLNDVISKGKWSKPSQKFLSKRESQFKRTNTYVTELVDNDFDWGNAKTYDFVISSKDPLVEKKLLEKFATQLDYFMKRDTTNPDILLAVSQNADESITTTYIPPTSRTINTGSKITPHYNYLTKQTSYTTQNNYRTVTEGGYNETTKTADIFLELSILDAKRINDVNQSTAPIIYQYTAKRHVVNPNFNMMDELIAYCSWATKCAPFWCMTETMKYTFYEPTIKFDANNVVTYIKEGSNIQQAGVLIGDKILAYRTSRKWYKGCREGYRFKVLRNGKTLTIANGKYLSFNQSLGDFEFNRLRCQND